VLLLGSLPSFFPQAYLIVRDRISENVTQNQLELSATDLWFKSVGVPNGN